MFHGDVVEQAKAALEYPSDFGYFGNDETFYKTSAPTITKTRDSNNRENAAFDIAWETLCEEFPDLAPEDGKQTKDERPGKFYVFGASHWAVGWIEQIVVPVLKEPGEITADNIHPAFEKALDLGVEFPYLDGADDRADEMNWNDVEKDIAGWQENLAERQGDPYVKAFSANELLQQLSDVVRDSDDYQYGEEDSIPYSWYFNAEREGAGVFGVLELHALACWDEAHQEVDGQEELPNAD